MNAVGLQDNGTASPAASSPGGWKWGSWRIPSEHLPFLVGAVCGGALILLTLIAAIVWRCCVVPRRDKAYCKSVLLDWWFVEPLTVHEMFWGFHWKKRRKKNEMCIVVAKSYVSIILSVHK